MFLRDARHSKHKAVRPLPWRQNNRKAALPPIRPGKAEPGTPLAGLPTWTTSKASGVTGGQCEAESVRSLFLSRSFQKGVYRF